MSLSLSKFDFSASAHILKFAPGRAQNRVSCERLHMRQWDDWVALPTLVARKFASTRDQFLAALPGKRPATPCERLHCKPWADVVALPESPRVTGAYTHPAW